MKLKIDLFHEASLELSVVRLPTHYNIRGIVLAFPNRRRRPHITVPELEGRTRIHFTVGRRFVGNIETVDSDRMVQAMNAFAESAWPAVATRFHPVDVEEFERGGWVVLYMKSRPVYRWIARANTWTVDERTILSFAMHMIRHPVPLRELMVEPPKDPPSLVALRVVGDQFEGRSLHYWPEGKWTIGEDGEPVRLHPAGWFWQSLASTENTPFDSMLPLERIKPAVDKIKGYLRRFPDRKRRGPNKILEEIPAVFCAMFGLYSEAMLGMMIHAKERRATRLARRAS